MGGNVVCMWVQLNRLCVCVFVSVTKGGTMVMEAIWRQLCVSML